MATSSINNPDTAHVFELTLKAFRLTRSAASAAAEGINAWSADALNSLRNSEKELDVLDRDIDDVVTTMVTNVGEREARELLACMKFVVDLERVGDLLLSFGNRTESVGARINPQDQKALAAMATRLDSMVGDAENAYRERSLDRAVSVLRSDAELDRLRNLIVFRHLRPPAGEPPQESFHMLFMAQELERAGDHIKNIAEEVCHLVSGRTVRHVLRSYDRPVEQLFIDYMRAQHREKP